MLSLKHTGPVPFKEVFCHSLTRNSEDHKMSKSLGNVISSLDVMHRQRQQIRTTRSTARVFGEAQTDWYSVIRQQEQQ
jgi:valyl-tRNA synthetase